MGGQLSKNEFRTQIRIKIAEVLHNCCFNSPKPVCFTFQIHRDERALFGEKEISSIILTELHDIIEVEDIPLKHISERTSSLATRDLIITEIFGFVVRNSLLQIWDQKAGVRHEKIRPILEKIEIPIQDFKIIL